MLNSKERKLARLKRNVHETLSSQTYNLVIGACILYGFLINAIIVGVFSPFFSRMNIWVLTIGYFVCCLIGVYLTASDSPLKSFIGYNFVVVPIGALVSVLLPAYNTEDILAAIIVTGAVVAVMCGIATAFPHIFAKMRRALFMALLLGLIAQLVAMLFGYSGQIFNWFFVAIFSLYIGYDWHKAQIYPKTLNNAIDSALDLYLDIINLFVRLLQIFGRSNRRN